MKSWPALRSLGVGGCILFLGLLLVGCASSKQQARLTDDQATLLATRLANNQATILYQCQPFHDGRPASFTNGHWHWKQLCPGDYEATVELAANGSTNRVKVYWLYDSIQPISMPTRSLPGGVRPYVHGTIP